jgi:hypothetical protein
MRCLLDKVAARRILEGLLKQTEARELTESENSVLDLFERAAEEGAQLYVAPQTEKLLHQLENLPRYGKLIRFFLSSTKTVFPNQAIRDHLYAMQRNLLPPYNHALLPQVCLPRHVTMNLFDHERQ